MMNLLVPLPSPEARRDLVWPDAVWDGHPRNNHITIPGNDVHQCSVYSGSCCSPFRRFAKQPPTSSKLWSFFVFSKQSHIQNVNAAHVLVWHLQSTHLIRLWNCCLVGVGYVGGGGAVDNPCHNERPGDMLLRQIGLTSITSAFQRDHVQWRSKTAKSLYSWQRRSNTWGVCTLQNLWNLDHQCI